MPKTTIKGLQEAQAAVNKASAAVKPKGAFGRAVKHLTIGARSYAVKITHVDSGGLKAAHREKISDLRGEVFIGPGSGPSGRPSVYGPYEHARGGDHAFYERTQDEAGDRLGREALNVLKRGLP